MLTNRAITHIRAQNWFGLILDVVVVVIGIFLAFQVDRWYDARTSESNLDSYYAALLEDFRATRSRLETVIKSHTSATESATWLVELGSEELSSVSHDDFYRTLREVQRQGTFAPARSTYDALVASGNISVIPSDELKTRMSEFFAFVSRLDMNMENMRLVNRLTVEPFIVENLDHAALMKFTHPDRTNELTPSRPKEQFREVFGTAEFEGVVIAKWHISSDIAVQYAEARNQVDTIEEILTELARTL